MVLQILLYRLERSEETKTQAGFQAAARGQGVGTYISGAVRQEPRHNLRGTLWQISEVQGEPRKDLHPGEPEERHRTTHTALFQEQGRIRDNPRRYRRVAKCIVGESFFRIPHAPDKRLFEDGL